MTSLSHWAFVCVYNTMGVTYSVARFVRHGRDLHGFPKSVGILESPHSRLHRFDHFSKILADCCYLFRFLNSGLLFGRIVFLTVATPRSAVSAVAKLLLPPVTVNFDVHLWPWPRCCQDEPARQIYRSKVMTVVQKLLSGHTDTHTGSISLPGPLKWSVKYDKTIMTVLRIVGPK